MGKNTFSIRDCASYGWRTTFNNIGLSVGILLTIIGVQLALGIMSRGIIKLIFPAMMMPKIMMMAEEMMTLRGMFSMVKSLFSVFFLAKILLAVITSFIASGMNLGFVRIALDLYDKGTSKIMRLFSSFHLVLKVWAVMIMASTVLLGGFLTFFAFIRIVRLMPLAQLFILVLTGAFIFVLYSLFVRGIFFVYRIVDKNAGPLESVLYSLRATKGLFLKVLGLSLVAGLSSLTIIGIPAGVYMLSAAYRKLSTQVS